MTEWRAVFWISFGIFVVTTVVYVIWASGEVQPWNSGYPQQSSIENGKRSSGDQTAEIDTVQSNIKLKD